MNSYSDTLSDFSSMHSTTASDKYDQNIKLNKNKHKNTQIIPNVPTSTKKKVT